MYFSNETSTNNLAFCSKKVANQGGKIRLNSCHFGINFEQKIDGNWCNFAPLFTSKMAKTAPFWDRFWGKICANFGWIFDVKLANFCVNFGNFCGNFAQIICLIFARKSAFTCNGKSLEFALFYKSKHGEMYFIFKNTLDLL